MITQFSSAITFRLFKFIAYAVLTTATLTSTSSLFANETALSSSSTDAVKKILIHLQQKNLLPNDLQIFDIQQNENEVQIYLAGTLQEFLLRDGDVNSLKRLEMHREWRTEALAGAWLSFQIEYESTQGLKIFVLDNNTFMPLNALVEDPPPIDVNPIPPATRVRSKRTTTALPFGGALLDKKIALSAGHGYFYRNGAFVTQRARFAFSGCGSCRGIVEDFFSAEVMSRYLIPLLRKMGAELIVVREPDHDIRPPLILDQNSFGYSEEGTWGQGSSSGGWNNTYRTNAPEDLGIARYLLDDIAPRKNPVRTLAVRYRHGGNRTPAALAAISHGGGDTLLNIDQRKMGEHWIHLGNYVFDNNSQFEWMHGPSDGFLISDAIKVGGGIHDAASKPWWQMSAEEYVPIATAPTSVTNYGDVSIRPAYAEYVGADAYVAIHGNASDNNSVNGLSIYRYSCQTYSDFSSSDNAFECDDPSGSQDLLDEVLASTMANIHADFDAEYTSRGGKVANFGEVRTLDDTPGILIESGFFTNTVVPGANRMSDNQAMQDPRWREAYVRGIAEGLARFLAPGTALPPRRPNGLLAANDENGNIILTWNAVPNTNGYHVFISENENAFAAPILVENSTSFTLQNLPAGSLRFFKVAALNSNGEGFDSAVVAAKTPSTQNSFKALIIDAYDRRDAWVQQIDNNLAISIEHGIALNQASNAIYFDGCLDEVLESTFQNGLRSLDEYDLLDFAAGKDSTQDAPVSKTQQSLLRTYIGNGGKLFLSGEEVAYALMQSNDVDDIAFLNDILGATFAADDAQTADLQGQDDFLAVGNLQLSNGNDEGAYEVKFPDVISPMPTRVTLLSYDDNRAAAVYGEEVLFLGFPFESLASFTGRRRLMTAILTLFLEGEEPRGTSIITQPDAGLVQNQDAGVPSTQDAGLVQNQDAGVPSAQDAGLVQNQDAGSYPLPTPEEPYRIPPMADDGCSCHASNTPQSSFPYSAFLLAIAASLSFHFMRQNTLK